MGNRPEKAIVVLKLRSMMAFLYSWLAELVAKLH